MLCVSDQCEIPILWAKNLAMDNLWFELYVVYVYSITSSPAREVGICIWTDSSKPGEDSKRAIHRIKEWEQLLIIEL